MRTNTLCQQNEIIVSEFTFECSVNSKLCNQKKTNLVMVLKKIHI